MENRKGNMLSNVEWYFWKDPAKKRFYEIFSQICQKYGVRWARAMEKERRFIKEVTRVTYEREWAVRLGLPLLGGSLSLLCALRLLDPQPDPHGKKSGRNQWSG